MKLPLYGYLLAAAVIAGCAVLGAGLGLLYALARGLFDY